MFTSTGWPGEVGKHLNQKRTAGSHKFRIADLSRVEIDASWPKGNPYEMGKYLGVERLVGLMRKTLSRSQACLILSVELISPSDYPILLHFFFKFYLFIYGCVGSSFLCMGFLQLRQVGAILHRGARASHHRGLSCCGAQAPDAQAQQPWLTGLVAPQHVGSSQTRAQTRIPCIGRQTPNHCATREALSYIYN